jgi:hypothetical protein
VKDLSRVRPKKKLTGPLECLLCAYRSWAGALFPERASIRDARASLEAGQLCAGSDKAKAARGRKDIIRIRLGVTV